MMQNQTKPETEKRHVQLEFPTDTYERLVQMSSVTHCASFAELVRNALRLYEWLIQQENEGYEIALVKDDAVKKTIKLVL